MKLTFKADIMDSRTTDCEPTTTLCAFQRREPWAMVRSENFPDVRDLLLLLSAVAHGKQGLLNELTNEEPPSHYVERLYVLYKCQGVFDACVSFRKKGKVNMKTRTG